MPHGTPDFQQTSGVNTVYQLTDMAELAARLGSIVSFDRRGDVVALDSFEDGIDRWNTDGAGAGYSVDLSILSAKSGKCSARLVAGSTLTRYAELYGYTPLPSVSVIGVEVSFTMHDDTDYLKLALAVETGSHGLTFTAIVNPTTEIVQIIPTGGIAETILSDVRLYRESKCFNTIKLVCDMSTGKYHRILINGLTAVLSDYDAASVVSIAAPKIETDISHYGDAGHNPVMYVDDFIVTQNER